MNVRQLQVVVAVLGAAAALGPMAAAHIETSPDGNSVTAEGLRGMLLGSNDLPGFQTTQCPRVVTSAAEWARNDRAAIGELRTEGFVMGVRESLRSRTGQSTADSEAVHFRTAAGAGREVVRQVAGARTMGLRRRFAVPAIPAGQGYSLVTDGGMSYHVVFSVRSDEYAVALAVPPGAALSDSRGEAEVIAAAAGILARTS